MYMGRIEGNAQTNTICVKNPITFEVTLAFLKEKAHICRYVSKSLK